MLLRPDRDELRLIGLYVGKILTGIGLTALLPAALGFARGETNAALGFVIAAGLGVAAGQAAELGLRTDRTLRWSHALVVVAGSWLAGALLAAIPLFLSGHYTNFQGAYFDAMSGLATAGLAVINDLDHLADSVNLWRHMLQFLGGQGLVLVALSVFSGGGGLTGLYIGEGREDRIMPNVIRTARFIWRVAMTYLVVGTAALWVALVSAGMRIGDGLFHAVTLFMAAFDTGGFSPTSASIGFYHSAAVEGVIAVLMVAGALSFLVHYHLWNRRPGELARNLETRVLAVTTIGLFLLTAVGVARAGTYDSLDALLRRGWFHVLSAHTGTGFATIPGRLFVTDWGALAPAMLVVAMALGGMAGSTAGGIKALRIGLAAKTLQRALQGVILPADAISVEAYHTAGRRRLLDAAVARTAMIVILLYVLLYFGGALVGLFYGYSFEEALFESTSAAAAVGLSVGVVGPTMPRGLMAVYILEMWIGRLEFVSVFALAGYAWSTIRGRL